MMEGLRCLLFHTKKRKHFENKFVLQMGGGPKGPRKRAALAPHFSKQNCFQNVPPCFCEITNISFLPLFKPRAKSESFSKIV